MKYAKKCFLYLLLNLIFSIFLHADSESLTILEDKEAKFDVSAPVKQRLNYVVNDILLNTVKENNIKDVLLLGVFNEGVVAKETAFIITSKKIYIFELSPYSKERDLNPPKLYKVTDDLHVKIDDFKRNDFDNEKAPAINLSTDNSAICLYIVDKDLNIKNTLTRYFFPSKKIKEIVSEFNEIKTTQNPVLLKNFKTISSLRAMEEQNILQLAEYLINKITSGTPITFEDEKKIFGLNDISSELQERLLERLANIQEGKPPKLIYSPLCELIRINKTLFLEKEIKEKIISISHSSWECSGKPKCVSGLNIVVFVKLIYVDKDSLLIELSYNPFLKAFSPDFYIYKGNGRNSLLEIGFYWDKENQKFCLKKDILVMLEEHIKNLYKNRSSSANCNL